MKEILAIATPHMAGPHPPVTQEGPVALIIRSPRRSISLATGGFPRERFLRARWDLGRAPRSSRRKAKTESVRPLLEEDDWLD